MPPSGVAGQDWLAWKWMKRDVLSTTETFRNLYQGDSIGLANIWRLICKEEAPQRVRVFIWLLWQNRLLTNGEQARKHVSSDCHYLGCGNVLESGLHMM